MDKSLKLNPMTVIPWYFEELNELRRSLNSDSALLEWYDALNLLLYAAHNGHRFWASHQTFTLVQTLYRAADRWLLCDDDFEHSLLAWARKQLKRNRSVSAQQLCDLADLTLIVVRAPDLTPNDHYSKWAFASGRSRSLANALLRATSLPTLLTSRFNDRNHILTGE